MANCADNTFRIRVKCTPCAPSVPVGDGTCCPEDEIPRQLCLTLTDVLDAGAGCVETVVTHQFNRSLVLTYEAGRTVPNLGCLASGGQGGYMGAWTNTITVTQTDESVTYRVWFLCVDDVFHLLIGPDPDTPPTCTELTCPGLCIGMILSCSENEVTVCEPFTSSVGNFVPSYDSPRGIIGNYSVTPVPEEGCGFDVIVTGECCDDELGAHPNLCVVWSGSNDVNEVNGQYSAVWSDDFMGTGVDGWFFELPASFYCTPPVTEPSSLYGRLECDSDNWSFSTGIVCTGGTEWRPQGFVGSDVGTCDPFSLVIDPSGDGTVSPLYGLLSITLGDCGSDPGTNSSECCELLEGKAAVLNIPDGPYAGTYNSTWINPYGTSCGITFDISLGAPATEFLAVEEYGTVFVATASLQPSGGGVTGVNTEGCSSPTINVEMTGSSGSGYSMDLGFDGTFNVTTII